jgi:uncharacterized protein involved in exopolysaccharide biosynthesis
MTLTAPSPVPTTALSPRRVFSLWDAISLPSTRNAVIAMVVAAIFATLTAGLVLAGPAVYQSEATLSIDQPEAVAQSVDTGVIEKLDRLRLKYSGLAETAEILDPIAKQTDATLEELRSDTDVVVGPQSLLLFPVARASTEAVARERAGLLADAIASYADREQAQNRIPDAERYHFTVVEPASSPDKISPTSRGAVAGAAVAAVFALGLVYVGLQLLTARRRLS